MKIKIKKLTEDAIVPKYAHDSDAGMDLYSNEDITINPGQRVLIKTGISIEFENGYAALIWDRSGLAINKGITKIAGVIDPGYRGEWKVALINLGDEAVSINKGERISQVLFQKVERAEIEICDELSCSSRGDGAFGSTGTR